MTPNYSYQQMRASLSFLLKLAVLSKYLQKVLIQQEKKCLQFGNALRSERKSAICAALKVYLTIFSLPHFVVKIP